MEFDFVWLSPTKITFVRLAAILSAWQLGRLCRCSVLNGDFRRAEISLWTAIYWGTFWRCCRCLSAKSHLTRGLQLRSYSPSMYEVRQFLYSSVKEHTWLLGSKCAQRGSLSWVNSTWLVYVAPSAINQSLNLQLMCYVKMILNSVPKNYFAIVHQ